MIIAFKQDGVVYVAFDMVATSLVGISMNDLIRPDNLPLFKITNSEAMMIAEDDIRPRDVLRYSLKMDLPINYVNLQKDLVNQMRTVLKEYSLYSENAFGYAYLLFTKDQIFEIDRWGVVTEQEAFSSLGYYKHVMNESLSMFYEAKMSVKERVIKVFDLYEKYINRSSRPIILIDTSNHHHIELIEK